MVHSHKKDFFHKLDRPLSALACNCLQLTCLEPSRESYCTYGSKCPHGSSGHADWMGVFCEQNPDSPLTLRDMVIPGTHDSASGTISKTKPFSASGRTQNGGGTAQLNAGVRYLDVRVAASSNGNKVLSIWHGCLEGGNYEDVLEEITDFVKGHPKEVLILEIVPEYGKQFSRDERRQTLDLTLQHLTPDMIIPGADLKEVFQNKPVTEISASPQRVAVLVHNRFFEGDENSIGMTEDEILEKYNFAVSQQRMQNPWHNTRDTRELLDKNLAAVEKYEKYKGRLLLNQFFATPGVDGAASILAAVMGQNSLRPLSHAYHMYENGVLDGFLRQHADKAWNIVSLDFVDLCPDIVDFCIALNWSQSTTMKILKAAVQIEGSDQDVTGKVQSCVCRGSVLFLVDPNVDLGIGTEHFTLTVAYSLSSRDGKDTRFHVVTMDVDCECSIVVSAFSCNEGAIQVEVTEGMGVVKRGQLYESKAEVPGGANGSILSYKVAGTKGEFGIV